RRGFGRLGDDGAPPIPYPTYPAPTYASPPPLLPAYDPVYAPPTAQPPVYANPPFFPVGSWPSGPPAPITANPPSLPVTQIRRAVPAAVNQRNLAISRMFAAETSLWGRRGMHGLGDASSYVIPGGYPTPSATAQISFLGPKAILDGQSVGTY